MVKDKIFKKYTCINTMISKICNCKYSLIFLLLHLTLILARLNYDENMKNSYKEMDILIILISCITVILSLLSRFTRTIGYYKNNEKTELEKMLLYSMTLIIQIFFIVHIMMVISNFIDQCIRTENDIGICKKADIHAFVFSILFYYFL